MSPVLREAEPTPVSPEAIIKLTDLLTQRTGILFPQHRHKELRTKLTPFWQSLSEAALARFLENPGADEDLLQRCINQVTIGESYFFRNRPHFNALKEKLIPQIARNNRHTRTMKIWCAGCATGEEPYSLSILLEETLPDFDRWDISILATDINTEFLRRAKEGSYSSWSFRGVEEHTIKRYFTRTDGGRYIIKRHVMDPVTFKHFNLSNPPFAGKISLTPFDLVICRNVLIYFSFDAANEIIKALTETITPGGHLIVGHAESFPALRELDSIYSNATYYYQRATGRVSRTSSVDTMHTVTIPGLSPVTMVKRTEPPMDAFPSPYPRRTPTPEDTSVDLELDLEEAQEATELGRLDVAKQLLTGLLDGAGKLDHRVHFLAALVADQEHRISDALASLRQAIFLHKRFAIGHYYQGIILEREGSPKAAARSLRNVLDIAEGLPDSYSLEEGGGMTVKRLKEIATERLKELNLG